MKLLSNSKLRLPATAVAAVGATAAVRVAHASPTVTFILSIDDNGFGSQIAGDFALYATDSIGDNYGISGIGMDVTGATSVTDDLPVGTYDDGTGEGNDDVIGFSLKHDNSLPVGGSQDTADLAENLISGNPPGYYMVYGIGQVAGNLNNDLPPGSTGPDGPGAVGNLKPNPYDPAYAGPSTGFDGSEFGLLVANGTFTSSSHVSFAANSQTAIVFTENGNGNFNPNGGDTEPAAISFVTNNFYFLPPAFSVTATVGNSGTDDASAFGAADKSDVVTVGPGNGSYNSAKAVVSNDRGFFDYAGFSQGDTVDIALKFTSGGSSISASEISALISYINTNDSSGIGPIIRLASPLSSAPASIQSALGGAGAYDVLLSDVAGPSDPFFVYDFTGFPDTGLQVTGIGVTGMVAVPESAGLSLLALGGLGLLRRRHRSDGLTAQRRRQNAWRTAQ